MVCFWNRRLALEFFNLIFSSSLHQGCGFILFAKKVEAEAAIVGLHMSRTDGASQPITVKKAKDDGDRSLGSAPPVQMMPHGFYPGPYPGGRAPGPMRRVHGQSYRFNPTGGHHSGGGAALCSASSSIAPSGSSILFVYNIGSDADESHLYSLFSPFGAVSGAMTTLGRWGRYVVWVRIE